MFEVGAVVARVKADITDFKQGMNEAKNHIEGFKSHMASAGDAIAGFGKQAAVLTAVVGTGLAAAAKRGLDAAAEFEQYDIAFNTLLKDRVKAQQTLKAIEQDAKNTPFELAPLVKANQLLISAGRSTSEARKEVLALGNAVAATGGGEAELSRLAVNLQQIQAVGKASALDIKQFAFAGINIYKLLSESTGKTVAEVKEMDVSYEMLAESLQKASDKGGMFEGAMKDQSKTLNGLMSTLSDTINLGLKDILVNSGAFDAIRNAVAALLPFLENTAVPTIVNFFKAISTGFALLQDAFSKDFDIGAWLSEEDYQAFLPFIEILRKLQPLFVWLAEWVMTHQEIIITFLKGLGIALGALLIVGTITALVAALLNPLVLVALAIAALYTAWQTNFWGIRDITTNVINAITEFFQMWWAGVQAIFQVGTEAVMSSHLGFLIRILQWTIEHWDQIMATIKNAWAFISGIFNTSISFISRWGGQVLDALVRPFQDAWNRIQDLVRKIRDALDFTKRHSPSVVDIVNRGVNAVNKAMEGLDLGVNMTGAVRPSFSGTANMIPGVNNIHIDLSGAVIADSIGAQRIGEMLGDSIMRKMKSQIKI